MITNKYLPGVRSLCWKLLAHGVCAWCAGLLGEWGWGEGSPERSSRPTQVWQDDMSLSPHYLPNIDSLLSETSSTSCSPLFHVLWVSAWNVPGHFSMICMHLGFKIFMMHFLELNKGDSSSICSTYRYNLWSIVVSDVRTALLLGGYWQALGSYIQ